MWIHLLALGLIDGAGDSAATLAANATASAVGTADLATSAGNDTTLSATASATAVASATATTSIRLAATPSGTGAASGALTTGLNLAATLAGTATGSASASTSIQLGASALVAANGLADLETGVGADTTLEASSIATATALVALSGGSEPVVYTPPASLGGGDIAFIGGQVFLRDEAPATKPGSDRPTKRAAVPVIAEQPAVSLDPAAARLLELEAANAAAAKAVADVVRIAAQDARQAQLAREQKRRDDNNALALWLALLDDED